MRRTTLESIFERQGRVDILHSMEQRQATTTACNLLELFDDQHLRSRLLNAF